MKNTKRRIELFSFFNHTEISTHLENMAAKGWMIEKITNFSWIYRRIPPKYIHFAISYYPKASEFDPEPSAEQKIFYDFCAHTGWQLACSAAQLQVFYNESENPTPIETEPELELQAIHATAKKSFIPSYLVLLLVGLLNGVLWLNNLFDDPIELLSSSSLLFSGFAFLLLGLSCTTALIGYFIWYSKAKVAAAQGEFLRTPSTSKFQRLLLYIVLGTAGLWIFSNFVYGTALQKCLITVMAIYIPLLFFLVNTIKGWLKRKKASRKINRAATLLTSFFASFAIMSLITFGILYASSHGFFANKNETTYQHGGMTWVVHQDKLPLTIEDLVAVDCSQYTKERRGNLSFLLGKFVMRQGPRFDAANYKELPQLEYTITVVKMPALYSVCREQLLHSQEKRHPLDDQAAYQPEDAALWGANEAYRLYSSQYGAKNTYLLCYDSFLVEIFLNWEPTAEQQKIVGQKLNQNFAAVSLPF